MGGGGGWPAAKDVRCSLARPGTPAFFGCCPVVPSLTGYDDANLTDTLIGPGRKIELSLAASFPPPNRVVELWCGSSIT